MEQPIRDERIRVFRCKAILLGDIFGSDHGALQGTLESNTDELPRNEASLPPSVSLENSFENSRRHLSSVRFLIDSSSRCCSIQHRVHITRERRTPIPPDRTSHIKLELPNRRKYHQASINPILHGDEAWSALGNVHPIPSLST